MSPRARSRSYRDEEGGQAVVLLALVLLAMVMMIGVAIDAGQLYSARRAMQEAADAAAYAGAVTLYQGGTQAQAFQAARDDATRNGYTEGVDGASVTVREPTASPFTGPSYVEVVIQVDVRTSLVPQEAGLTTVRVQAISGAESLNNNYAIMALDRGATPNAFRTSGATITLNGGGVVANSTAASAAVAGGDVWNITCPAANPCAIDVAGTTGGTWPAAHPDGPDYFNGVRTGQPQAADPFAGYPKPSTTGLATDQAPFGTEGITLREGIYTTTISGRKLCHGTYILRAGMGGDVEGDKVSVDPITHQTCDGRVLIFNTTTTYPLSGGTCTGVDITGNHEVGDLLPPSSGGYKGMLFYQDPACTAPMRLGSSAFEFQVQGTIYLPTAAFVVSGGHPEIAGGQIVAKTVDLGAADVRITFNAGNSAQPILPRLAK